MCACLCVQSFCASILSAYYWCVCTPLKVPLDLCLIEFMCLPQYQLSCNKPWACHPTDNYILFVNMFIMAHYSVGTTVPLFHCIYALHSIKPSSDDHGYSTVSMTVPLSLCVNAHHSIKPSCDGHGYSTVSTTVPLSLCVYAHHSIQPPAMDTPL